MDNVRILIDGNEVDYDVQNLPVSFSRKIDLWDKFVGTEGDAAQPLGDTLFFPATAKNSVVFGGFDALDAPARFEQGLRSIRVYINGALVFSGECRRASLSKEDALSTLFAVKLLPSSMDLFGRMNETSLRDLAMGNMSTEESDILDTWVDISDTDTYPVVFAPVNYGGVTSQFGSGGVYGSVFLYNSGFRPAVRIWRIVEAIFKGYEIVSNIYQTQAFRNALYMFSVGDDWERADNIGSLTCFVGANAQTISSPSQTILFNNETGIYSDPSALNSSGLFIPPSSGWYKFELFAIGSDTSIESITMVGDYRFSPASPFTSTVLQTWNLSDINYVNTFIDALLFEPNYGLTRIRFVANLKPTFATGTIDADTFYKATAINRFAYGQPLRIASCLHDRNLTDFWKGLQHAFGGLVLAVDNVARKVYFDPRFNNATQTDVRPRPLINPYDAYYKNNVNPTKLQANTASVFVEQKAPYGDFLQLSLGEDSSDALYKYAFENGAATEEKPLMGARILFASSGKNGTVLPNPFFTYMLNYNSQATSNPVQEIKSIFPCIVDNFDFFSSEIYSTETPSFSGSPKIGMYYGMLDFSGVAYQRPGGLGSFYYFVLVTSATITLQTIIPAVFQLFPDELGYFETLGGNPFSLSYATLPYENTPAGAVDIMGLIDRYYQKYLSIIGNDKWIKLSAIIAMDAYRDNIFQSSVFLEIAGKKTKCWQVYTDNFQPLQSPEASMQLVVDFDLLADGSPAYSDNQNKSIPLLVTGYNLRLEL